MNNFSTNKIKPTIIGAGIGGLSLAIGLQKQGIECEIYESTPELNEVGAGIVLANNAMQVYKQFGLYEDLINIGNRISQMEITKPNLKPLSTIQLKTFEEKYDVHGITIHRAHLQRYLSESFSGAVHLNHPLNGLNFHQDGVSLKFNTQNVETKCLFGADGIHSVTRSALNLNEQIRNARQLCWRGVTEFALPVKYDHTAIEVWGPGKRFGVNRLNKDQVYWYALINGNEPPEEPLEDVFNEFHPLIMDVLKSTAPKAIICNEIIDLKPIHLWYNEFICLMGDAAHTTTPNLGQGACQAIEDGWVLSNLLGNAKNQKQTFAKFQDLRRKKAHGIVEKSWSLGKLSQIENRPLTWLRNGLMRMSPDSVGLKTLESTFNITEFSS